MNRIRCDLTGQGLADFAECRIGLPYFYGAKISHGILTEAFMQKLHEKLPELVTDAYMEQARQQGQVGKVNTDCSGLIGAYLGVELSSAQMYAVADRRLWIQTSELSEQKQRMEPVDLSFLRQKSELPDQCFATKISNIDAYFPVGTVLWKPGHVGVFFGRRGGEDWCVEAKGINYGTICSNVTDTDWQCGLLLPWISYDMENCLSDIKAGTFRAVRKAGKVSQKDDTYIMAERFSATRKGENPYLRPCVWIMCPEEAAQHSSVKKITYGEGVRWLQWELCEAGYPVSVDGIFGSETRNALQKFQISCELRPDGIAKFEELEKISLSPGSFHV